jgi:energy-converting hydrogenase Eha subunit C
METERPATGRWVEKGPPLAILAIAFVAVVAAFVLRSATAFDGHIVGYLLGSVACTALVVAFMKVDTARRTAGDVFYLEKPWTRYLWSAVLLAGIIASALHAWSIATTLAVS